MIRIVQIVGGVDHEGNEMIVGLDSHGFMYEYQHEMKPREQKRTGVGATTKYYSGWTAGWRELPNSTGLAKEVFHPEDPRNGVREG